MSEEKVELYTEKVPLSAKTAEIIDLQPDGAVQRMRTPGLISQGLALLSGLTRLALRVVETRQTILPSVQDAGQRDNVLTSGLRAVSPFNRQGRGQRRNRWRHGKGGR